MMRDPTHDRWGEAGEFKKRTCRNNVPTGNLLLFVQLVVKLRFEFVVQIFVFTLCFFRPEFV